MAKPQSREELKEYCLRRLGHPVLEINVAEEQIDDAIDDALQLSMNVILTVWKECI